MNTNIATARGKLSVPGLNGGTLQPNRGGRPKGSVNRATSTLREHVVDLMAQHGAKFGRWLGHVAEGVPDKLKPGAYVVAPDPGRALALVAQLGEYAVPKLARIEHTGADGGPLQIEVVSLALQMPSKAPSGPQAASMVIDLGEGT